MTYSPRPATRRPRIIFLSDNEARRRLSRAKIILTDGRVPVIGRIIRWSRTGLGALAAIVENQCTGVQFVVAVNIPNHRHDRRSLRVLSRIDKGAYSFDRHIGELL